jgi:hypothetical protein
MSVGRGDVVRMLNADRKPVHALVIPWPASKLQTWCGHSIREEPVSGHDMATSPGAVTCPHCARAMRDALKNLADWVPGLTI